MAIYIGLGANQVSNYMGNSYKPVDTFAQALGFLANYDVEICSKYSIWQSPAWPNPRAQPAYKNTVVQVKTKISPSELLTVLKNTEAEFGREPSERNAPRPLDLDILDYHGQILNTQKLSLPHPRMCERAFVLFPLQDIAPIWRDPIKNRTIQDWIARLPLKDVGPLKRLTHFTL